MQNLIEMQYFPKVSINVVSHKTQMQNHYHFYNLLNGKMAEQRLLTQRDYYNFFYKNSLKTYLISYMNDISPLISISNSECPKVESISLESNCFLTFCCKETVSVFKNDEISFLL